MKAALVVVCWATVVRTQGLSTTTWAWAAAASNAAAAKARNCFMGSIWIG